MTYSTGGLIQATDYNKFVQGGAAVDHNVANVNSIWGTGYGDKGYGQSGLLATVSTSNTVTATQWATLIARLNSISAHQSGSNTGITAPVTGGTIAYLNALQTFVTNTYNQRFSAATEGTDSPTETTTHRWSTTAPTTYQIVREFTFSDPDQARYFFNGGGQIYFGLGVTNNIGNLKSSDWQTFLVSKIQGLSLRATAATPWVTTNVTTTSNKGYWGLTTTDQVLYAFTSASGGAYTTNSVTIKARTNGVQGVNGDNGTKITITIELSDVAADTDSNDYVDITVSVNAVARRPETTNLSTAIAYPSLTAAAPPVVYTISPNTSTVSEGGSVTFTVNAYGVPDGTVLYWTQAPGSTTVASDFTSGTTEGSVTITAGVGTFIRTLTNDVTTEGSESFSYYLRQTSTAGTVLASSSTVTVSDTSTTAFVFSPTISATTTDYNLRAAAVAAGWNQTTPIQATVTIAAGAIVGATSTSAYAFDTGTGFPAGSSLSLINNGSIYGAAGSGGAPQYGGEYSVAGYTGGPGSAGGPAFRAQVNITVTNNGTLAGGGGGGGAGGSTQNQPGGTIYIGGAGGPGAGYVNGVGLTNQTYGPPAQFGDGRGAGEGGTGGALGTAGYQGGNAYNGQGGAAIGLGGAGGSAGYAVTGDANVTWNAVGSRVGAIA